MNFVQHLYRQLAWSQRTFGTAPRTRGLIDHIGKELREIEADPADLSEWIDVIILATDGALNVGYSPEEIAAALAEKLTKNERRMWPALGTVEAGKAIEHVRTGDVKDREGHGGGEE